MADRQMNETDKHVAARIVKARNEIGLAQIAFADVIGVNVSQLVKYEHGKNRLSAGRLHDIAKATGKPIEWFFPS